MALEILTKGGVDMRPCSQEMADAWSDSQFRRNYDKVMEEFCKQRGEGDRMKRVATFICTRKKCMWRKITMKIDKDIKTITCFCGREAKKNED